MEVDIPPKKGRQPRRNVRDPRLRCYKRPTSPIVLTFNPVPRHIPTEYKPVSDARRPVHNPGLERRSYKVVLGNLIYVHSICLIRQNLLQPRPAPSRTVPGTGQPAKHSKVIEIKTKFNDIKIRIFKRNLLQTATNLDSIMKASLRRL